LLEGYLSTGECKAGEIGTPDSVRDRPNASFDLGLALFKVAEHFGARFGDESAVTPGQPVQPQPGQQGTDEQRSQDVDCALRVVRIIAADAQAPADVRAKAEYLTGNLEFLRGKYEDAVAAYDAALKLSPGRNEDPDSVGSRAAWNRAIALRRIEENKKPDAGKPPDEHPDGGNQDHDGGKQKEPESSPDAGSNQDKKDDKDKKKPGDQDKKNQDDKKKSDDKKSDNDKKNGGSKNPDQQNQKDQSNKNREPSLSQDERMLDVLEQAPTVQQEAAKKNAAHAHVLRMEDK
jgi:hypothetical protein